MKNSLRRLGILLLFPLAYSGSCDGDGQPQPPADAGAYHTYAEVGTALQDLATRFPNLCQVSSIGQSLQGRELWAIKISDNVSIDEPEPEVLFVGGHHAREWIAVDVPLLLVEYLAENYASDRRARDRVDGAEIWVVPLVNPDGHQYSVTNNRLWRKNRRNNGDGTFGVDLNRNYSYQWGGPGSSGDTFSEIYRGPAPFSEPETAALRDFVAARDFRAMISYHSYSQLILYPWGYTSAPTQDAAEHHALGSAMADSILAVHGKTYVPEQASQLYLASGDTGDWLYNIGQVPAFTFELRPRRSNPGFLLPESEIQPTFEENLPAALRLIEWTQTAAVPVSPTL